MPSGGARIGAGRPKGSKTKRHQVRFASGVAGGMMPLDYMLALMRDEEAEPARRDAMAIQCAAYCHPKLGAVLQATGLGRDLSNAMPVIITAVPHGAVITPAGAVTIDGEAVTELPADAFLIEGLAQMVRASPCLAP